MKWISVDEKLPDAGVDVLCFQPKTFSAVSSQTWKPRILMGYLFSLEPNERGGRIDKTETADKDFPLRNGGTFWSFPYICHQNFVTHWMPLPDHPVEYCKNCYVCGRFVKKDLWTRKDHPRGAVPMCKDCASVCDDPYNY